MFSVEACVDMFKRIIASICLELTCFSQDNVTQTYLLHRSLLDGLIYQNHFETKMSLGYGVTVGLGLSQP